MIVTLIMYEKIYIVYTSYSQSRFGVPKYPSVSFI